MSSKVYSRRSFVASVSLLSLGAEAMPIINTSNTSRLAHQVYFWLKNPASSKDQDKLIEGLRTLSKIETVRELHIGFPASTEKREVVEDSFSVSELIFFDDVEGQNIYQDHPIHKTFVAECSSLWTKVIVYDSMIL